MKKLLSLLSLLTISSATMPMVVATAPYQKQETKLINNEINSLETNNLGILKRNKRENINLENNEKTPSINLENNEKTPNINLENNEKTPNINLENNEKTPNINLENNKQDLTNLNIKNNNEIFTTPRLHINGNANEYFNNLKEILKSLLDNEIILNLNNTGGRSYFSINGNVRFNYFIIPFSLERDDQTININLIFRLNDFYLQGFSYNTTFYHFSDSNIITIPGQTSRDLNFNSDYGSLMGGAGSNPLISWAGIEQAFNDLVNFGENPDSSGNTAIIRAALGRVILATAESMRFRQVRDNIERTYNQNIQLSWASDFYPIITNWSSTTKEAINYLIEHENSLNGFTHNSNILIFTTLILSYLNNCNSNLRYNGTCYIRPKLSLFLNRNQKPVEHFLKWCNGEEEFKITDINLEQEIPISYNKITFFNEDEVYSKFSWGNDPYIGRNVNDVFKNKNIKDIITNFEAFTDSEIKQHADKELIDINLRGSARGKIHVGLTFYWNSHEKKWHLQILGYLYGESWTSWSCGGSWLNLGRRIELS